MNTKKSSRHLKSIKRLLKGKRGSSDLVEEKDGEGEEGSSSGGWKRRKTDNTTPPERIPSGEKSSYLGEDTATMDRNRRLMEQEGHRQHAKVNARSHSPEESQQPAPEGELQNSIQQHPWLDAQRFDGIDPNLNPEPPLNTAARREFDNERREQEMEKQLRLGNMPKFSTAPKPSPS